MRTHDPLRSTGGNPARARRTAVRCRPAANAPNSAATRPQPTPCRQKAPRQTLDDGIVQVDRSAGAQDLEECPLPGEKAGERDHERGNAKSRHPESVEESDERTGRDPGDHCGHCPAPVLHLKDRHHRCAQSTHRARRKINLSQQKHQNHSCRDGPHGGDLQHQVGEIARGEKIGIQRGEDPPEDEEAGDDRKKATLPAGRGACERRRVTPGGEAVLMARQIGSHRRP